MIRLLCTFTTEDNLQSVINDISTNYDILNGKIFILQLSENPELACTYNIESGNLSNLLDNTISIHRRKENNVLYTINGLNYLIKSLNNNILDKEYKRLYNSPCAFCGATEKITMDHIIPISRSGNHSIGNLQPLCRRCNSSKKSRLVSEYKYYLSKLKAVNQR